MRVVGLDDDGAAGRECRCGVAARHRERQREVAGAKHRNRAEGNASLANVGSRQRRSVGQRRVDAGAVPVALAKDAGKQPELSRRAADLAGQARLRQAAFGDRALDDGILDRLDIGGDRFEELGTLLGRRGPVLGERRGGGAARRVDVGRVTVGVAGLELPACDGIEGADLFSRAPNRFAGDEHLSRQVSVGHRRSHDFLGLELSTWSLSGTNGRSDINACPRPITA